MAKLTREYAAIRKDDPRSLTIAEELSQLGIIRDEIQKILQKLGRSGEPPLNLATLSPTVATLLRQMNKLIRQFADTQNPDKSEIVNEITRLSLLADLLSKSKTLQ